MYGLGTVSLSRIRGKNISNPGIIFDMNVELQWGATAALYCEANNAFFTVTQNSGTTLNLVGWSVGGGDISIDGIDGLSGNTRAGSFVFNGTVNVSGDYFLTTNNPMGNNVSHTFGPNAIINVYGIFYGNAYAGGPSTASLTMLSGSTLRLFNTMATRDLSFATSITKFGGSTIEYAGINQTIDPLLSPFANLAISGGGTKTLMGATTVNDILFLNNGVVLGNGNTLTIENGLGAAVQGGSASSYVNGTLQRRVDANRTYDFPVSDAPAANGFNNARLFFKNSPVADYVSTTFSTGFTASSPSDIYADANGDGAIDEIGYDCVYGGWQIIPNVPDVTAQYDLTLSPSAALQAICAGSTLYPTIGKDGAYGFNSGFSEAFVGFSIFDIIAASTVLLPIELVEFTAVADGNMATLNWTTATEEGSAFFGIEHSQDALTFAEIGRVQAAGTSNTLRQYNFNDTKAANGINYYRLRMVDTDGEFSYSEVRAVNLGSQTNEVIVSPNPTPSELTVQLPTVLGTDAFISVTDLLGREVMQANITAGNSHTTLNVNSLSAGQYTLTIQNDSLQYSTRFIKR